LLKIKDLEVAYGDVVVLRDIELEVNQGEIVALVGANGAGKTTLLRTASGLHRAQSGSIHFEGQAIDRWHPHKIVDAGLIQVAEGRKLFPHMTVLENLEMGSFIKRARIHRAESLERVFRLFPLLAERASQDAGTLSGGEQQMLAIGRALMTQPTLLMLDEPSLGLAPLIVKDIFRVVEEISRDGTTVLIVEQNAVQTLKLADRGYVLENGRVLMSAPSKELLADESIRTAYLGL
jgi:branched-chain amino acid transport system ATP-binding protein